MTPSVFLGRLLITPGACVVFDSLNAGSSRPAYDAFVDKLREKKKAEKLSKGHSSPNNNQEGEANGDNVDDEEKEEDEENEEEDDNQDKSGQDKTSRRGSAAIPDDEPLPPGFIKPKKGWVDRGFVRLKKIVCAFWFNIFVLIVTFANAVVLSLDHYNIPEAMDNFVNVCSIIFTVFFWVEGALKFIALGPKTYIKDLYNALDAILCFAAIPDMIGGGGSAFSALRAFRLFRALRLARNWKSLQKLLKTVAQSVRSVALLSLILLIVIYIFAIVGVQQFGGVQLSSRIQFSTLYDSILAVIILVSGEQWSELMQELIPSKGGAAVIYFLALTVIGNFVLLNLFIAIILQQFSSAAITAAAIEAVKSDEEALMPSLGNTVNNLEMTSSPQKMFHRRFGGQHNHVVPALVLEPSTEAKVLENLEKILPAEQQADEPAKALPSDTAEFLGIQPEDVTVLEKYPGHLETIRHPDEIHITSEGVLSRLEPKDCPDAARELRRQMKLMKSGIRNEKAIDLTKLRFAAFANKRGRLDLSSKKIKVFEDEENRKWIGTTQMAFGALHYSHPLRRRVIRVVKSNIFEYSIIVCILMSAIFLSLDSPVLQRTNPSAYEMLVAVDVIFVVIFTIEMIMKMIAMGAYKHEGAYLRDPWNVLDLFVVTTSYIALGVDSFKVMRSLRVARLLSKSMTLRLVLRALLQSVPGMGNVTVLGLLVFWIFGIVGVALFKGELNQCTDDSISKKSDCVGYYNATVTDAFGDQIVNATRIWVPRGMSFDHLGLAMLALTQIAIKDGWYDTMYFGIDSQDYDMGPRKNASQAAALYFVCFLVVGGFLLINLFIGVLVDRFSEMKALGEGSAFMTDSQKVWVMAQKVVSRTELPRIFEPPPNGIRRKIFFLVESPYFGGFFTFLIVVNSALLASRYEGQSSSFESSLLICSMILLALFTMEALLKIIAFSPSGYLFDNWNRFDAFVVVVSWVGIVIGGEGTSIIRLFRIGRMFMIIKRAKGLQMLISTLIQALPAFLNITAILLVVYFIFGIAGVELFGDSPYSGEFDAQTNFDTIINALMTLYVVGTSETWMSVMEGTHNQAATAYFLLFMLVGSFIVMNLLVTVITESFDEASEASEHSQEIALFGTLQLKWIEFDPKTTQRLHANHCIKMLTSLPEPLWYKSTASVLAGGSAFTFTLHQLKRLHIPINESAYVRYQDVVAAVGLVVFGLSSMEGILTSQKTSEGVTWDANEFSLHHHYAACFIKKAWKQFLQSRSSRRLQKELNALKRENMMRQNLEFTPLKESQVESLRLTKYLLTELRSRSQNSTAQELYSNPSAPVNPISGGFAPTDVPPPPSRLPEHLPPRLPTNSYSITGNLQPRALPMDEEDDDQVSSSDVQISTTVDDCVTLSFEQDEAFVEQPVVPGVHTQEHEEQKTEEQDSDESLVEVVLPSSMTNSVIPEPQFPMASLDADSQDVDWIENPNVEDTIHDLLWNPYDPMTLTTTTADDINTQARALHSVSPNRSRSVGSRPWYNTPGRPMTSWDLFRLQQQEEIRMRAQRLNSQLMVTYKN